MRASTGNRFGIARMVEPHESGLDVARSFERRFDKRGKIAPKKPSNVKANNEHQDSGVGTSWRRQCFAGKVQIIRIIDLMTNE